MALGDLTNFAANFEAGSISRLFDSGVFASIYFFVKVFVGFVFLLFVALMVYKFYLQYNIRVTIKSRIGTGGLEVKNDLAKLVVDDQNKRKLQLFKTRKGKNAITCPVPESRFKGKQGRFDHYELWMDDNFQLHPVDHPQVLGDQTKLDIRPQERDAWARYEDKILEEKYKKQDLLAKWAPAGIMVIACITAFLIFFFAFKELGAGMADLAAQFSQIAASCTKLG